MSKTKILITGGAGYIGSHAVIEFLNLGFEIISVDNLSNSSVKTYDRINQITGKLIRHYQMDICNLDLLTKVFEENPDIEGVIHFAALKSVPESVQQPLLYFRNNVNALLNVLECMKNFQTKYLIFSSSCSVYGNVKQLPVNEETPVEKPESPYAYTKVIGEQVIQDFLRINPWVKASSLRYFNPVGAHSSGLNGELPSNRPNNLVPVITRTAIGKMPEMSVFGNDYNTRDGSCIRDYIHVSDIADAHVKAYNFLADRRQPDQYSLFNLGSGKGVTVLEAISSFEKIANLRLKYKIVPRREGDVEAIYSDCSKAKRLLNWIPKNDIDSMMKTAWDWEKNLATEKIIS